MADLAGNISSVINPISAGAGIIEGGIQLFDALKNEKKDKAALANIKDPFYRIQDEFLQNRNIAEDQAQGGLPTATKDYLTSESQRGLGAGVSGILQGGGNVNDINKLFDTYNKSIDRTAAEDAEMHQKNIDYFIGQNTNLAGEKIKQFTLNQYLPTQEKKKQLSENIAADKANVFGGANTAIGSTSALGTSLENNYLLKQLFKTQKDPGLNYSTKSEIGNSTPSSNESTVSSNGYIDPFTPNLIPNYSNPFQ